MVFILESRQEYLEQRARRRTLCFGLVVIDFRDCLGLSTEYINDERPLGTMDKVGAMSKNVQAEAKQGSKYCLARQKRLLSPVIFKACTQSAG
jgi:hypothetical protein